MIFETKYNPGDRVWYMGNNQIRESTIKYVKSIHVDNNTVPPKCKVTYSIGIGTEEALEHILFESKADLISHLSGSEL